MPSRKNRFFFLLCLAVALTVVSRPRPNRQRPQPATADRPAPFPAAGARPTPAGKSVAAFSPAGENLAFPGRRETTPDPDVIAGEWQLLFATRDDLEQFLRQAVFLDGVTVIDQDEILLSARVKTTGGESLARQLRQLDNRPQAVAPNHRFHLPATTFTPGQPPVRALLQPYGGRALEAIGQPRPDNDEGRGVTVALIDTGVRDTGLFSPERLESIDLRENDGPGTEATAAALHGTVMAAIIGGQDELLPGVAPAVSLLDIRALDNQGQGDGFTIARGIVLAVDRGAEIINLSVGGLGDDLALRTAIAYAEENGVTVVAAAGNEGSGQLDYPARYPEVVAVGAVDAAGQHPEFSNSGREIDLAAPGYGVYAPVGGGRYVQASGTSTATAFVSGTIAGVMAEEGITAPAATGLVICFALDLGSPGHDFSFGIGLVNMDRIRDRFTCYDDLAAAGYFWQPAGAAAAPAKTALAVSVQNRGTTDAWDITVAVRINGFLSRYYLDSLAAGESGSVTTGLTREKLAASGHAAVSVAVSAPGIDDAHPENNITSFYLSR